MDFEFATAGQIVFGWGRIRELRTRTETFGRRVLVVTGSRPARTEYVQQLLRSSGAVLDVFSVDAEPTTTLVQTGVE